MKKIFVINVLLVFLISTGCNDRRPESEVTKQDWAKIIEKTEKAAQNRDKVVIFEADALIYDFIESVRKNYEIYDSYTGEALVYIEASKKYNKPVIEVYRSYMLVKNAKAGVTLSVAEIDTKAVNYLRNIGFYKINDKWYFDNAEVNMGNPLAAPEQISQPKPETDKCFEVTLQTEITISELKKIQVKGETNLPDDTQLILSINNYETSYSTGEKVFVRDGNFTSSWFSDLSRPAEEVSRGNYMLEVTTPTAAVMGSSVRAVVGDNGKYMTGNLVEFDEVNGNRVKYRRKFRIP